MTTEVAHYLGAGKMPIIAYLCECRNITKRFFRGAKEAPQDTFCSMCGKKAIKVLSVPSTSTKITIDDGLQARSVEIIPNIVELNHERSSKDYKEE